MKDMAEMTASKKASSAEANTVRTATSGIARSPAPATDTAIDTATRTVRELLPRTWHAFYARFGRLTPIQRLVAGPIVRGEPVLLGARTASGKTEAVLAPILERALARGVSAGVVVLYICPTRALANDLGARLESPLRQLGFAVRIKTGDTGALGAVKAPSVVITTPESLDSMLCRAPRRLSMVRAVVMDELHLMEGTARGDQLRCLLERLDRVAPTPQRCGASATVAAPERLVADFMGSGGRWLHDAAARPLEGRLVRVHTYADAAAVVVEVLRGEGRSQKVLVFANSRSDVEGIAALSRKRLAEDEPVFAHHGSLSRSERLRVEARFRAVRCGVCVATTTMEIGVDIGDVDQVVLYGPPPSVGALLQRAGRSNRRSRAATPIVGLCQHESHWSRFEHLLSCASEQRLFDDPVPFRPDVIAQQLAGLVFQNPAGWVTASAAHARLPANVAAHWSLADVEAIAAGLASGGVLRAVDAARFVADDEGYRLYECGKLHSLICDSSEVEVVDRLTGTTVGRVDRAYLMPRIGDVRSAGNGQSLSLGGINREVHHARDGRLFVDSVESLGPGRFAPRRGPRCSRALAQDYGRFLGLPHNTAWIQEESGLITVQHFLGTVWGRLLEELLKHLQPQSAKQRSGPFQLTFRPSPTWKLFERDESPLLLAAFGCLDTGTAALRRAIETVVDDHADWLERVHGAGPLNTLVPAELRRRWRRDCVNVPALCRTLERLRLVRAPAASAAETRSETERGTSKPGATAQSAADDEGAASGADPSTGPAAAPARAGAVICRRPPDEPTLPRGSPLRI